MKKLSLVFIITALMVSAAHAQEFKTFKVAIGGGFAKPAGSGASGGVLLYIEPAYRVMDELAIGLRLETALVARGSATDQTVDLDVAGIGSYTLNAQYYFSNETFRPFVGAGLGLYNIGSASVVGDPNNPQTVNEVASISKFGFYPRIGFDARHFTLSIDYNFVPDDSKNNLKNSYLGIRVGGFFGGGRK